MARSVFTDRERGLDRSATSRRQYRQTQQPTTRRKGAAPRTGPDDAYIARNIPIPIRGRVLTVSVAVRACGVWGRDGEPHRLTAAHAAEPFRPKRSAQVVGIKGKLETEIGQAGSGTKGPVIVSQEFSADWKRGGAGGKIQEAALLRIDGPFFDLSKLGDLYTTLSDLVGPLLSAAEANAASFWEDFLLGQLSRPAALMRDLLRLRPLLAAQLQKRFSGTMPEFPLPLVPFVVTEVVPATNGKNFVALGVRMEGPSFGLQGGGNLSAEPLGVGAGLSLGGSAGFPVARVERTFPFSFE